MGFDSLPEVDVVLDSVSALGEDDFALGGFFVVPFEDFVCDGVGVEFVPFWADDCDDFVEDGVCAVLVDHFVFFLVDLFLVYVMRRGVSILLVLWLAVDLLHGFCGVFLVLGFVSGDEACAVW